MKIFILAVEPSADQLGADLAVQLTTISRSLQLSGIGGPRMEAVGIESVVDTGGLAILGITEALKSLPLVYQKITDACDAIEQAQPDMVVMIDSYGFMIRLAERMRKRGFDKTLVKYVAPQVWATRPSRAKRLARLFDALLTIHPFEAEWFTPLGLPTYHVGNAVFDTDYTTGDGISFRAKYNLADRPILSVFFGSRPSEVSRLAGPFHEAVRRLTSQIPDLKVISPVSDSVTEEIAVVTKEYPALAEIQILSESTKLDVMAASTAALACSGTVTTQLACAGVPTVVAYRMSGISYAIMSRLMRSDYVSMVNIAAKRALMPEFLQTDVTGEALSDAVKVYLTDTKKRAAISDALISQTDQMRGSKSMSASARAAQAILEIAKS